jgi:hypothetical protein
MQDKFKEYLNQHDLNVSRSRIPSIYFFGLDGNSSLLSFQNDLHFDLNVGEY